jgi:hypothetical protein
MYSFLRNYTPRSVNAKHKTAYYNGVVNAFHHYHRKAVPIRDSLYGCVYYFHRIKTQLDADNLSKPIWDALKNVAFIDDQQIRYRSAGLFNLQSEGIDELDLSNMPNNILIDFLKMIDKKENNILYVEFGKFDYNLIRFGCDS